MYVALNMVMQNDSLHDCVNISLSTRIGTKNNSYNRIHYKYLLFRPYFRTKTLAFHKETPKTLTQNKSNEIMT
jgi:hypothetical protein